MSRTVIVATCSTWQKAVDEALRRRVVCREKFGAGCVHGWKFRVCKSRSKMWRDRHALWQVTFNSEGYR